jgi:hypothetical protein
MVDGLLKNLNLDDPTAAGLGASSSSSSAAPLTPDQQQLVEQLGQLGFKRSDAEAGVRAAVSNTNAGDDSWEGEQEEEDGGTLELQPVLDWLCLHVPESRLPAALGPGEWPGDTVITDTSCGLLGAYRDCLSYTSHCPHCTCCCCCCLTNRCQQACECAAQAGGLQQQQQQWHSSRCFILC